MARSNKSPSSEIPSIAGPVPVPWTVWLLRVLGGLLVLGAVPFAGLVVWREFDAGAWVQAPSVLAGLGGAIVVAAGLFAVGEILMQAVRAAAYTERLFLLSKLQITSIQEGLEDLQDTVEQMAGEVRELREGPAQQLYWLGADRTPSS